jgi:hypothetical protein
MTMFYHYHNRLCHISYEWAGGLVSIRFGSKSNWQGEIVVPFSELVAV